MAYMQKPGRAPLKNKNFEALTNGTPLRNHKPGHKDTKTGNEGRSADNVGAALDKGGTRTQKDATTGKKISTDAKSRKMNKDAASGKINKKLTGNVTQKNGNYSAKPYKGKMMDHGRLSSDGKTFTRTTGGKNSPGYRAELKKHNLPTETSEEELLKMIDHLNRDIKVSGIIVQLPLPQHINQEKIQESINPIKDVDCFNPVNIGKLTLANTKYFPCTPNAIYEIMKRENIIAENKHTVIVGRSNIVGKPLALILLQKEKYANATITICHSRTKNLSYYTRQADILIVAVGRAGIINKDMVKEGAVIIDVGTNEVGGKLTGDVAYDEVLEKVSAITPVPGGVGPVTNVMLMKNTLTAAEKQIITPE